MWRLALSSLAATGLFLLALSFLTPIHSQPVPAVNTAMGCSSGQVTGNVGGSFGCVTVPNVDLTGTTSAIGGGLLSAGACTSGTATITGADVGMAAVSSPTTYPGDGVQWQTYVSSANTVTVKVCGLILITPVSSTYNVRVVQ